MLVLAHPAVAAVPHDLLLRTAHAPRSRTRHAERVAQDSVYASAALRALVARMAADGREPPRALAGYHTRVASEIAVVLRTAAAQDGVGAGPTGAVDEHGTADVETGRERALQIEQVESTVDWTREEAGGPVGPSANAPGRVEQHVIGYRATGVTAAVSALSILHRPWIVPVLYGNRLQLLLGRGTAVNTAERSAPADSAGASLLQAVHPFAEDRERVYRFTGGDTVASLRSRGEAIPIVRITVEPHGQPPARTLLFRGEIDVDAVHHQIVRMRGLFVVVGRERSFARSVLRRVLGAGWQTVAFAELENGQFDGRFWLPSRQRLEGQARTPLADGFRPVFRIVSRFRDHPVRLAGDTSVPALASVRDTARPSTSGTAAARLTMAPGDSISAFRDWSAELGAATMDARATDFDDVAPDSWRPQGAPRFDLRAERVSDVLRFNRVEGVLGLAAAYRFRNAAPGLAVGGALGWAFTEETGRGNVWARVPRGGWLLSARGERTLANTNDFRPTLDYEQSITALLVSTDDYDYMDRRSFTLSAARLLPVPGAPLFRLEVGPGYDAPEGRRVSYGIFHVGTPFRPNRAVTPGGYVRSAIGLDLHPNVSGEFLEPGIGAGLWYERGDGALRWQRLEVRLTAWHRHGAFTYAGRVDAIGVTSPGPVPQQLVEFGENEGLPGYGCKEFGGDRAVLGHAVVIYELPFLRAPIPVRGLSGRLGGTGQVLLAPRPTDGVRSTVNATLRFFGGTLGFGVARPLDQHGGSQPWQFVVGVGQPC